jgi:hypothetical protein
VSAIGAGVVSTVQAIEQNAYLLTGASKPAGIIAFASAIAVVLGRMFQAAHLGKAAAVASTVGEIPDALKSLAAEAQDNAAHAPADGVDNAGVPAATA